MVTTGNTMKNIMLDLETMGTSSTAAIVAIGAVEFDPNVGIVSSFYETIKLQSSIDKGAIVDGDTVMWWLRQTDAARKALSVDRISLGDALKKFKEWIPKGNVQVWGNGSDFDNVILANAYLSYGVKAPWQHYFNRCYRTIISSYPRIEVPFGGVQHNALNDAEHQAKCLVAIARINDVRDIF